MRIRDAIGGFTLIEMLAVMAIMALLVALGAGGMRDLVRSQRIKSTSFDLYSSLTYARSEAITRNGTVTVTPAAGNWANGWTISDASSATLRTQTAIPDVTITGPASVSYNGMGRLNASVSSFSVTATGMSGSNVRCISIDLSGRPVVKAVSCS